MSLTDWTRDEIINDESTVKDVRSLLHSLTVGTDEELRRKEGFLVETHPT